MTALEKVIRRTKFEEEPEIFLEQFGTRERICVPFSRRRFSPARVVVLEEEWWQISLGEVWTWQNFRVEVIERSAYIDWHGYWDRFYLTLHLSENLIIV